MTMAARAIMNLLIKFPFVSNMIADYRVLRKFCAPGQSSKWTFKSIVIGRPLPDLVVMKNISFSQSRHFLTGRCIASKRDLTVSSNSVISPPLARFSNILITL
jgi:hypothetical protein